MPQITATCPVHGEFPTGLQVTESNGFHRLEGNVTTCPRCSREVPIPDGTYYIEDGRLVRRPLSG